MVPALSTWICRSSVSAVHRHHQHHLRRLRGYATIAGTVAPGVGKWVVVACIAAINGLFHVVAAVRGRKYSPGVITGALLYVPLAVIGIIRLHQQGLVSTGTVAQGVIIAGVYQLWSSRKHRRASVAVAR